MTHARKSVSDSGTLTRGGQKDDGRQELRGDPSTLIRTHRPSIETLDREFRCGQCDRSLPWLEFKHDAGYGGFGRVILHPHCLACRKTNVENWPKHPLYSEGLVRFWDKAIQSLRSGARSRRMVVALGRDDLVQMFLDQNGRCALTGAPMLVEFGVGTKNNMRPSVDRIDSSMNYTLDNVHIVAAVVNIMKSDMTRDQFVMWCRRVIEHEANKQDELLRDIA